MSITNTHPDYTNRAQQWRRLREAVSGRDALLVSDLGRGLTAVGHYVPPLSGQTKEEYHAYVSRAVWFGATDRTINGLAGLIFARDPVIDVPPSIDSFAADVTASGVSARAFAQQIVFEELTVGRVGVLVEFPSTATDGMTEAQAMQANARPYLTMWPAESILDWRMGFVAGIGHRLTFVKLAEMVEVDGADEFTRKTVQKIRVLDLVEGVYRQRVFIDGSQTAEVIPRANGAPFPFIPFQIVGGTDVRKPLLLDLCDVNLAHYRMTADYLHGLHFAALPTPVISGYSAAPGDPPFKIGGASAWVFPAPSAHASMLEFQGAGMGAIKTALDDFVAQMAVLGARMLVDGGRGANETATGAELKTAGERGTLAAVARDVSDTMRLALAWMSLFTRAQATQDDIQFSLNTDYRLGSIDPQMLAQLMAGVQSGIMPMSVFFNALRVGGMAPDGMAFDDYMSQLETMQPAAP